MDQKELVKQLEAHFREEEQSVFEQREQVHQQKQAQTDDEWWQELVERTRSIRPQMLSIFERNKDQMIANRFKTVSSELDFREKVIQKRVMELLPFVSALRSELAIDGALTKEQIGQASARMELASVKAMAQSEAATTGKARVDLTESIKGFEQIDQLQDWLFDSDSKN